MFSIKTTASPLSSADTLAANTRRNMPCIAYKTFRKLDRSDDFSILAFPRRRKKDAGYNAASCVGNFTALLAVFEATSVGRKWVVRGVWGA